MNNYSPALEMGGYTGFTLSFRGSVIPLFCEHFISTQYLEKEWTESDLILYAYLSTLTRSSLGLLPAIFHKILTDLWPLINI